MKLRSFTPVWTLLVFAVITGPLGAVSSKAANDDRIDRIQRQLNQVFRCPERIWPRLRADAYRVVFLRPVAQKAWFWTASSGEMVAVPFQEAKGTVQADASYAFVDQFRGARAVAINLEQISEASPTTFFNADKAALTAFHEAFHWLYQFKEPWVTMFAGQSASDLPKFGDAPFAEALYARKMMKRSLRRELLKSSGFGATAYWRERLKATGRERDTFFSDVMEGTAWYVENVAAVIATSGCAVSEQIIFQSITQSFDQLFWLDEKDALFSSIQIQLTSPGQGYQPDSYEIGLMALLALRQREDLPGPNMFEMGRDYQSEITSGDAPSRLKAYQDLQSAIAKAMTPVDLMLGSFSSKPVLQPDDIALQSQITEITAKILQQH